MDPICEWGRGGEGEPALILPRNHSDRPGERDGAGGEGPHNSGGFSAATVPAAPTTGLCEQTWGAAAAPRAPHPTPFTLQETQRGFPAPSRVSQHPAGFPSTKQGFPAPTASS